MLLPYATDAPSLLNATPTRTIFHDHHADATAAHDMHTGIPQGESMSSTFFKHGTIRPSESLENVTLMSSYVLLQTTLTSSAIQLMASLQSSLFYKNMLLVATTVDKMCCLLSGTIIHSKIKH